MAETVSGDVTLEKVFWIRHRTRAYSLELSLSLESLELSIIRIRLEENRKELRVENVMQIDIYCGWGQARAVARRCARRRGCVSRNASACADNGFVRFPEFKGGF